MIITSIPNIDCLQQEKYIKDDFRFNASLKKISAAILHIIYMGGRGHDHTQW